jgi:uncharacterized Zn-binding protein involved in type VI secretion
VGKPAARIGDTTAHGGAIVAGAPTVIIGGKPAARQGDMHTCPLVNPGVPPPPHAGGPATLGSPMVLICGQMALRMGDMLTCSGPPDTVAMGCPTVLIGEGGAGGGGGAGPAGAVASAALAGGDPDSDEEHFLDVKFTDKKGNPIKGVKYDLKRPDNKNIKGTLGGKLRKTGVPEGNYDVKLKVVTNARWSKKQAKDGETVKMSAEACGFESGTKAKFEVWEKDANKPDELIATIEDVEINGDKVEAEWQYVYVDEEEKESEASEQESRTKYQSPSYYFTVKVGDSQVRSPLLGYKDFIELYLNDIKDSPIADARYRVFLSDGEVREGQLDSNGYAKVENVPPGKWGVEFPDYPFYYEDVDEEEDEEEDEAAG